MLADADVCSLDVKVVIQHHQKDHLWQENKDVISMLSFGVSAFWEFSLLLLCNFQIFKSQEHLAESNLLS